MVISAAFITPVLPVRATKCHTAQVSPTMLLFRNPRNPFNFGSSGGSSRFFGGKSPFNGGSFGSGFGSGGGGGSNRHRGSSGGGAADNSGNVFTAIWNGYNASLEKNPIITKALTSLVGFFLGDLIAQKFLGEKGADIDKARLARMASFGFLIHGPTGHYFYSALDRVIVGTAPLKVASKVVIDQVFWAPIFTALFFGYLGVAERKSFEQIKEKVKNDTWKGVQASWKFWPLAHTINFAFIPTAQRLLYINTLQVGYNVILSLLGNK
ncbi:Protein sym-1 [Gracilariopsis chorda]|uniref:Protein sym-1 n=1 Tax=Gracilariopsis chorda TaxID=448386 RepID=A0A2V3ITH9_9FLOR|nr:Protein sym-1 [Gracilariopsis chorda]|eukprot:PXF45402.1 Protein sym-1 [Gracilariopsis chorda]